MGSRKQNRAEQMKAERKTTYIARLNNCPTSPRKMRLVADMVRGADVASAAAMLQFSPKEAAGRLEKLLWSAIANYEQKTGDNWEGADLFVKEVTVDSGRMLKRIQPAPQGRAHRVRKRSNHVTLILGSALQEDYVLEGETEQTEEAENK